MSQDKFTPGPWHAAGWVGTIEGSHEYTGVHAAVWSADRKTLIAPIGNSECEVANANANLIAAAPDLKKALERACTLLHATSQYMKDNPEAAEYEELYDGVLCDGWCLSDDCESAFSAGIAALAKARGEA